MIWILCFGCLAMFHPHIRSKWRPFREIIVPNDFGDDWQVGKLFQTNVCARMSLALVFEFGASGTALECLFHVRGASPSESLICSSTTTQMKNISLSCFCSLFAYSHSPSPRAHHIQQLCLATSLYLRQQFVIRALLLVYNTNFATGNFSIKSRDKQIE